MSSIYFGDAVITAEMVNASAAPVWGEATAFTADDWFVLVAQYDAETAAETEEGVIDALEIGYAVSRPIPYRIERVGGGNYEASFTEANIAIGGVDPQDAYQSLVAEILDTFDTLLDEPDLGADAAAQLQTLQQYIVKT